ncbi:MAG: hypothetical protein JWQ27_2974 [Ferruginibacter sp.]|nr:hypothetical protein [Ferruginibacter sp.]
MLGQINVWDLYRLVWEVVFSKKKVTAEPKQIKFVQGTGKNLRVINTPLPSGYNRTKLKSHGQAVYSNGKNWITPDRDGHNGGVWKMYASESDVGESKRLGTFGSDLKKIGK